MSPGDAEPSSGTSAPSCPTTPEDVPRKAAVRESWFRRVGTVVVACLVGLALLGVLGPRTTTDSLSVGDRTVEVERPTVLRRGLDSQITVTVPESGSPERLRVALNADAVADLGLDTIIPEPASTTSDGDRIVWEFADPGGEGFHVTFFGRTPTKATPGRKRWELTWLSASGDRTLHATTWVLP